MPLDNSQFERNIKKQARSLSNLTGCKLTQAQRTLAIDLFKCKSWSDLKVAIAANTLQPGIDCLVGFTNDVDSITYLRENYDNIHHILANISYLNQFDTDKVIAQILNLSTTELKMLLAKD